MGSVALVVLWYEHPELWAGFRELAACGGWDELVVIDNGSGPMTAAFLQKAVGELGPGARVFRQEANECLLAWNAAALTTTADLLVVMPNDFRLTDARWFEWVIEGARPGVMQGPMQNCQDGVAYIDGITAIWRGDWARLGGRDECYWSPGYWEDVDFCWRAQRIGIAIRLTRCGVHHIGGVTTRGTPDAESQRRWLANQARFRQRAAGVLA